MNLNVIYICLFVNVFVSCNISAQDHKELRKSSSITLISATSGDYIEDVRFVKEITYLKSKYLFKPRNGIVLDSNTEGFRTELYFALLGEEWSLDLLLLGQHEPKEVDAFVSEVVELLNSGVAQEKQKLFDTIFIPIVSPSCP